jgi:ribosomal protein S18 acetylase RimI-like enzyme
MNLMLEIPTSDDFRSLTEMEALAFAEKNIFSGKKSDKTYTYRYYQEHHPSKLQHLRIVRDPETRIVIGGCQLMLQGDPPSRDLPILLRHELLPGEAYIEWIACHPKHTGKGIGSTLLNWAETFARENGALFLSLEVMHRNQGAIRLYERKGFVVKKDPHMNGECDECFAGILVFCCLGCVYWKVCYMEKFLETR